MRSFHFVLRALCLKTAGRTHVAIGIGLVALLLAGPAWSAEAPVASKALSLNDCIDRALARNLDLLSSREEVVAAEGQRTSARGDLGPRLRVDGSYQRWTEPYAVGGFSVHEATVWNVTTSLTQPLTGLFAIYDTYRVRDLGVDVAAIRHDAIRRQTAFRVVEGYNHLLQAQRLGEVASTSVEQLDAQLRQANSFHTNGVVSKDDVLRAQLALAGAQQRLIQARARVTLDRSRLAVLLGMSPGEALEVLLPGDAAVQADPWSLAAAQTLAEAQRPELREVEKRIEQARLEKDVAKLQLVPQVSAVGSYIHNVGSLFSQTNAAYVGGVASWDVFEWGKTAGTISAAKARANQALLARDKLKDEVRMEVEQAFVNVGSTAEASGVARASVAAAEENFRLVKKRYDASAATSFDVIDAEGLLTQARAQLQTAVYDSAIARAALRHAVGMSPKELSQ